MNFVNHVEESVHSNLRTLVIFYFLFFILVRNKQHQLVSFLPLHKTPTPTPTKKKKKKIYPHSNPKTHFDKDVNLSISLLLLDGFKPKQRK